MRIIDAQSDLAAITSEGESALNNLKRRANYDPCFHSAFERLRVVGCANLNAEARKRFSLSLAKCHLASSGIDIHCDEEMTIERCTSSLASMPIAFNAYTEFFIQADSICFFLEKDAIDKRISSALEQLYESAGSVARHLQDVTVGLERTNEDLASMVFHRRQIPHNL